MYTGAPRATRVCLSGAKASTKLPVIAWVGIAAAAVVTLGALAAFGIYCLGRLRRQLPGASCKTAETKAAPAQPKEATPTHAAQPYWLDTTAGGTPVDPNGINSPMVRDHDWI
jgi:hypothetical protein